MPRRPVPFSRRLDRNLVAQPINITGVRTLKDLLDMMEDSITHLEYKVETLEAKIEQKNAECWEMEADRNFYQRQLNLLVGRPRSDLTEAIKTQIDRKLEELTEIVKRTH